jgi:DNA-binding transcriptional LysR family regulator
VFLAAADQEHFSRAAVELHISQPAVSSHVKDLERYLGVQLFERVGREVRLTRAGQVVKDYAQRIVDLGLELEQATEDVKAGSRMHLTIGASTTPGGYLLPPLLSSFCERHPAVDVAVEIDNTAAIADRLRGGKLNVGLLGAEVVSPDLKLWPWREDRLVLVVAPGHRWHGCRIQIRDLLKETLVAREPGSATGELTREALAAAGISMRATAVLGNSEAVKGAVARGMGVAFLSESAVAHELADRKLGECTVAGLTITRTLQVAQTSTRRLTPAEAAFTDWLCSNVSSNLEH